MIELNVFNHPQLSYLLLTIQLKKEDT